MTLLFFRFSMRSTQVSFLSDVPGPVSQRTMKSIAAVALVVGACEAFAPRPHVTSFGVSSFGRGALNFAEELNEF